MPGSTPPTSQLDWLISTTAMIVLFWSRATRDLLKSFGWGIAALHRLATATKLPSLAACPIASLGPADQVLSGAASVQLDFFCSASHSMEPGAHAGGASRCCLAL